jgi:hypothetical protein
MDLAVNVILIMLFGTGAALFYVGSLIVVVTSFGKQQYAFGALSLLLPPLSVVYCLVHRQDGKYASRYLLGGAVIMIIAYIVAVFFHKL